MLKIQLDVLRCALVLLSVVAMHLSEMFHHTCWDVQQLSGLPSVKYFFPTDLSNVELTLSDDQVFF